MFCRQDTDMGPNNIQPFAPEFRKSTCASNSARPKLTAALRIRLQAMRQRTFFYSPPLNAKEFIQILLRASYSHAPEHYSTKYFVVRPAARSKITLESDHQMQATRQCVFLASHFKAGTLVSVCTNASIAAMVFLASHF